MATKTRLKTNCQQCRICLAPAGCSYFGVISCTSCKTFFRRNANAQGISSMNDVSKKFSCRFDGQCEVNINTRHLCTACRLAKCFALGMSTDFFRGPRTATTNSTRLIVPYQSKKLPTLNLLERDISTLTTDQWTLLSNLTQIYDESQLVSIAQRFTQIHLNTTDELCIDRLYGKLIQQWMMSVCETTLRYLRLNGDICQLPLDDRSLIIRTAAANISCMGGTFAGQNYPLYEISQFTSTVSNIYGEDVTNKHRWSMKFMDSDSVLLKLGLSLFVFSELNYSYTLSTSIDLIKPLNVVKIQHKYAELTWRYLLHRYGHNQAVRRFLKLTTWFLATVVYMDDVQNVSLQVNDVKSLVEETELKLVLDDVDRIVEMTC